jgi:S1-C subfamily serine protease
MQSVIRFLGLVAVCCTTGLRSQELRLVRSISGPSGKVQGANFVFDEARTRFVYPQDSSFVVYFEWEAPVGSHVLTALCKQPDGRVGSISPDIKIDSNTKELTSYWTYIMQPEMLPGVWTIEVRVDGQPAGSHSFEIAGTSPPKPEPKAEAPPKPPTLDEIFRATSPSLVSVQRFDGDGKRTDTASGFVIGKDQIATALQAIDGASRVEIEFANGRKVESDDIQAFSRAGDWAIVAAVTENVPALQTGDPSRIAVGERLIAFNFEGGARAIGGVDISGRHNAPEFGERIQFSPPIPPETAGGPLLDLSGKVVGIVGGSVLPGGRFDRHHMSINPALGMTMQISAATPISVLPAHITDKGSKLGELVTRGALTSPLSDMEGLIYVGTAREAMANPADPLPRDVSDFSRRDKQVWVFSEWLKKGKISKGLVSAKVYDQQNRLRITVDPKKVSLSSTPLRSSFTLSPSTVSPGIYRIDLYWDTRPVWRTFIRITD